MAETRWHRFRCWMEWHLPALAPIGFDGCSFSARCRWCGKRILQDSQGNWFEASRQEDTRG